MEKNLYCVGRKRALGGIVANSSLQEKLEGPTFSDSHSRGLQGLFHETAYFFSSPLSLSCHFP
jgi:hypothetical protein